ncbi:MAG: hypothetical protein ACVCEJ_06565 [Candidatus Izemoplasmataceae bacterium]
MIKRLMMLFVLVASVMVILLMLIKPREEFYVLYKSKSYSMMKSSNNESFQIDMLASMKESFYMDEEFIVRGVIRNQKTDEQVSIEINDIHIDDHPVQLDKLYYPVVFDVRLSFAMDSFEITYNEAVLELVFENQEMLSIEMGEFYYLEDQSSSYINVLEMIATHEVYHGLTVSGLYLELAHNLPGEIIIREIALGSSVASINPFYTKEMHTSVSYDDQLKDILYPVNYDHVKIQEGDLNIHIRRSQTIAHYFPFTYLREDLLMHRFYLKIIYLFEGEIREEVIDDFPYIRQNMLAHSEEEYDVYYPRMQSEFIRETIQES